MRRHLSRSVLSTCRLWLQPASRPWLPRNRWKTSTALKKDLEDQGQKLRKKAELLKNPKTSEDAKLAFLRSKQDLDQKTRNFMRKVEQDEVKLRQDMVTLVFNATYEVAQRKGYNFVVDVTAGGVLYAEQSMDLTQEVLAEVNKLYKEKGDKAKEPMTNGQKTPAAPAAPAGK